MTTSLAVGFLPEIERSGSRFFEIEYGEDDFNKFVEVRTIVIPSIPLVEARERFLTDLRWKSSRVSGRHLQPSTGEKYRHWLNRFERWLVASELPLDLGGVGRGQPLGAPARRPGRDR